MTPDPRDRARAIARSHGLAGLDGLQEEVAEKTPERAGVAPLRFSEEAAERIRLEITRAGGREVCFLASVSPDRMVVEPRAVARGNRDAVLAAAVDADRGGLMIHNHPSGLLEPSEADLAVAVRLWEEGVGSAITDNGASGLYVVVEPPEPEVKTPLDVAALEALLAPGGPLGELHAGFEDRPGQREMLRRVAERFNEGGTGIVEAGTGTGKSLAYLLPAAAWALQNRERTVVSTNTIQLQEQLVGKDLPLVRGLLGDEVDWALVKGRGNYVSIRRAFLAEANSGALFGDARSEEIRALVEWTRSTTDGSLSDLPSFPSDEVWEEVQSDADVCLRSRCPHFTECFYQRSRRRAFQARILVVNHHLLLTDIAVRRATGNFRQPAVLPPYRRVILDEAHNLEDAATSHLGVEVTRAGLLRVLGRLDRKGRGILTALHQAVSNADQAVELRARLATRLKPALDEAREALLELFAALEPIAATSMDRGALRLGGPAGLPEPVENESVGAGLERAHLSLARLEREVGELRRRLPIEEGGGELEARSLDLQSLERRLAAAGHALRLVLEPDASAGEFVRWLELRGPAPRQNLVLAAAPVDPGGSLRESLFAQVDTAVMTSATLTTRGRFDFVRQRVGLARDALLDLPKSLRVVETLVPSPFDFARQTLLVVPTDLPDAGGGGSPELQAATSRITTEMADVTGGGLFVLLTSHRALRDLAERLRSAAVDVRFPLFVQGEDGRSQLLERFVRSGRGILLGTNSFWEGVDVPGHPLRALVIQKLPFRVPTEPITAARWEAIERSGGDPFADYVLPLAALRLKQGFGRLVRSRQDRGAVVLLDDRIIRRRYGRYLRDSLPDAPLVKGPWPEMLRSLERFYGDEFAR